MTGSADRDGTHKLGLAALLAVLGLSCAAGPSPSLAPATAATTAPLASEAAGRQILVTFVPRPALELPRAGSSAQGYDGMGYKTTVRTQQLARQLGHDYGMTVVAQ